MRQHIRSHARYFFLGVLIVLAGWAVTGPDEAEAEMARYCELVHLNKQDPSVGWPDFNHNYDTECTNDGLLARSR